MPEVGMLGTNPLLGAGVSLVVGTTARTPEDLSQTIQDMLNSIGEQPIPFAVRMAVTLAIVAMALFGGRWLAGLAGRVPVGVDLKLGRAGRLDSGDVGDSRTGLSRWLGRLTLTSVWIAALVALALTWLGSQRTALTPDVVLNFFRPLAVQLGASLVVLACTLGLGRILERSVVASMGRGRANPNLTVLIGRVIYTTALVVGLIVILAIWGTGIVVPVALVGTLTVALSLALQDVLKNVVAGVYLLVERPFVIGDTIVLTIYQGEIEDIRIRYTALHTPDGQRIIIPNSLLFSSAVINLSFYERRRAALSVSVPDEGPDGVDRTEERIRSALDDIPGVLHEPQPEVIVNRATAGKVDLHVVFWMPTKDFGRNAAVYSEVIERVRAQVKDAEVALLDASVSPV
jgi:small-conductance mechanosensitive channel